MVGQIAWLNPQLHDEQEESRRSRVRLRVRKLRHGKDAVLTVAYYLNAHSSAPPTATVALEQLKGRLRPMINPTPHETVPQPSISSRRRTYATSPTDLILTDKGICNYVPPDGEACGMNMSKISAHPSALVTHHAMKEMDCIDISRPVLSIARPG
jgi:hypothetical protein